MTLLVVLGAGAAGYIIWRLSLGRNRWKCNEPGLVGRVWTFRPPIRPMNGMHSMMYLGWAIGILVVVLLVVAMAKLLRK